MTDVNLEKLEFLLSRCLKLVAGTRRLFRDLGIEVGNLKNLAGELQKAVKEVRERIAEVERNAERARIGG